MSGCLPGVLGKSMNPRSVFWPERNSSGTVPEGTVQWAASWAGEVATVTVASNNPTVILPARRFMLVTFTWPRGVLSHTPEL